ncbi:DUF3298 and DUF4163 domain-containing protein [Clostridium rectalis]|uniref:DUF3298 and DUF4163 domain-containing protein n=1 Tax=Clostridium rectalis TaxID=2040295 RepID=UPI000F635230|nr:DUF3298 and DUF4163 domain-containing protein [Clostridium rectalis]
MIYFRYPEDNFEQFLPWDVYNENFVDEYEKTLLGKEMESQAKLGEQILKPNTFKLTYPFVTNLQESVRKKVNEGIIDEVVYLFKDQVLYPENIDFKEVISFYEVPLNEKGLLSILFGIYTFTGGAHGYTKYSSITLDLNSGKVYSFSDLFNPKIYYKGFLDEIAKQYIKDNNIPLVEEYNGIHQDQKFYLTPNELVLYYQVYEYTPYYYGVFKIIIPYDKILNLLGPMSPIQKLINK